VTAREPTEAERGRAPREPLRPTPLITSAIVITGVALVGGFYFAIGCSENLHPGTDRERICTDITGWDDWLLLTFSPLLALFASQAIPWIRRHPWLAGLAILTVTISGWTTLLLIASSSIGDTSID
jgi:hypothetical protein